MFIVTTVLKYIFVLLAAVSLLLFGATFPKGAREKWKILSRLRGKRMLFFISFFVFSILGSAVAIYNEYRTKQDARIQDDKITVIDTKLSEVLDVIGPLQHELITGDKFHLSQDILGSAGMIEPSTRAKELASQIPDNSDTYSLALKAVAEHRYDDARNLLNEAERNAEVDLFNIYTAKGQNEIYAGCYKEAVSWYERARSLRPDDVMILSELGTAYFLAGRYAEAQSAAREELTQWERISQGNIFNMFYGRCCNELAVIYSVLGKYSEAEPLFNLSLLIAKEKLGPDHKDVGTALKNLGDLHLKQANFSESQKYYEESINVYTKGVGENTLSVANILNSIGLLYFTMGQYRTAEEKYNEALAITENLEGDKNPSLLCSILINLGNLHVSLLEYDEANAFIERARGVLLKSLGSNHPIMASCLTTLAVIRAYEGKYEEAEEMLHDGLRIREDAFDPYHPRVCLSLDNLSIVYAKQEKYNEAVDCNDRSLSILRNFYKSHRYSLGLCLHVRAQIYFPQHKYVETEAALQEALQTMEDIVPAEHPHLISIVKDYSTLLTRLGRDPEAKEMELRIDGTSVKRSRSTASKLGK